MDSSPISSQRPVSVVSEPAASRVAAKAAAAEQAAPRHVPAIAVESLDLDDGPESIDHERVAELRHRIESGRYPVVPAKIADAMIAAGLFLRRSQ